MSAIFTSPVNLKAEEGVPQTLYGLWKPKESKVLWKNQMSQCCIIYTIDLSLVSCAKNWRFTLLRIYWVSIDLRHQYGICAAESQTFLGAKRPQRRRARSNGCFRRLFRFDDSQHKVLLFLFKDFLLLSGRVESRDKMCILENHQLNTNDIVCIWQSLIFF